MKYLNKLQLFPDCIYRIPNGWFDIYANSFKEVIERYKKYNKDFIPENMSLLKVEIINQNCTNYFPEGVAVSYKDVVQFAKDAYKRTIYISPDLSQIYGESFSLAMDDTYDAFWDCIFDYDLLYGDIDINIGEYKSDFYKYDFDEFADSISLEDRPILITEELNKEKIFSNNADVKLIPIGFVHENGNVLKYFGDIWEYHPASLLRKIKQ